MPKSFGDYWAGRAVCATTNKCSFFPDFLSICLLAVLVRFTTSGRVLPVMVTQWQRRLTEGRICGHGQTAARLTSVSSWGKQAGEAVAILLWLHPWHQNTNENDNTMVSWCLAVMNTHFCSCKVLLCAVHALSPAIRWISCLLHHLVCWLRSPRSACMLDCPRSWHGLVHNGNKLPGDIYSRDQQCDFQFPRYTFCSRTSYGRRVSTSCLYLCLLRTTVLLFLPVRCPDGAHFHLYVHFFKVMN